MSSKFTSKFQNLPRKHGVSQFDVKLRSSFPGLMSLRKSKTTFKVVNTKEIPCKNILI